MKSILITFLFFAAVLLCMYFNVFELISSTGFMFFAIICVILSLIFALKILGNPFKDKNDDQK